MTIIKINVAVWQHKFIIDYQEISLEYNSFNHDDNKKFLLEGDGHNKNDIEKNVVVHKIYL